MKLVEKVQSRKFALALLGALAMFAVRAYDSAASIVIAYVGFQAAQDALSDWQSNRSTELPPE